ncbi:leucine rich repeat domain containing protein [Niveomyces insectorum RCEF 264]|uniref:Leucine rich repeat domain containing protein n=1 Tax=Niveomyces insectorum RCEF 264 TaxID=1081102 RepID=A0A167QEG9_9HYPO|nr:leucine rich repeat domain containing protein [Niveomyces insectorum RCEF 264]
MAFLPSYEDAVTGGHWLDLAASHVAVRDYARLCRVSLRFYNEFAPRLWNDPLQTVLLLGLSPVQGLEWYVYFVAKFAKTVRRSTRLLVTSLDFRGFTSGAAASFAGFSGPSFSRTLSLLGSVFPAVRCIFLDGHGGYDPDDFPKPSQADDFPEDGSEPLPLILSLGRCSLPLPHTFFHSPYWRQLVYLDLSDLPGSLRGLIKNETFRRGALPNLRILKLRGRELDGASVPVVVASSLLDGLWSLDVSRNKLTDGCLPQLFGREPALSVDLPLQGALFDVEGKLVVVKDANGAPVSSSPSGAFFHIAESASSASFLHPDRYLADAPVYDPRSEQRLTGSEPLRRDSADGVKRVLAGGAGLAVPDWHALRELGMCKKPPFLTHLYLSGNRGITPHGVEVCFRHSRGHLEHFDCGDPDIPTSVGGRTPFSLTGILGRSHISRPVVASNLRQLRIHHSFVTHIPTLTDPSRSALDALAYAETVLRARAELAYPQAFVPDLNPRLQSLTLTCLPRVSAGPLIDKLIAFLRLAYEQEKAIRRATVSRSRRGPAMLQGLRHLCLEFAPYPLRDAPGAGLDELDAEALLNSDDGRFSFFGEEAPAPVRTPDTKTSKNRGLHNGSEDNQMRTDTSPATALAHETQNPVFGDGKEGVAMPLPERPPVRLAHYPLPGAIATDGEHVREVVVGDEDRTHPVHVWVGTGVPGPSRAVNAYMANLAYAALRTRVLPASPDQVKAGVPAGSCVYTAAWDAILWIDGVVTTQRAAPPPGKGNEMLDVVDAVRQFRAATKAAYVACMSQSVSPGAARDNDQPEHNHWTGTLALLFTS